MKDILTKENERAISNTYDIIANITAKQGFLLPFRDIFGDGSRFLPMNENGVKLVYDVIKEHLDNAQAKCYCGSNDVKYVQSSEITVCNSCGTYW